MNHLKVSESRVKVRAGEHEVPARWRGGVPGLTGGFGNGLVEIIGVGADVYKVPGLQEVLEFGNVLDVSIDISQD